MFVTIGIAQQSWMEKLKGVRLTLLPLKVGELTAEFVQSILDDCILSSSSDNENNNIQEPLVTVKWPNDVLLNEMKISGTLIESANGWFLIGIGINLEYAPNIPTSGKDYGRPSVSVQEYCPSKNDIDEKVDRASQAGIHLAYSLHSWLHKEQSESSSKIRAAESIVEGWKRWLDWDMELVMRDTPGRKRVRLVDVLADGPVQIMDINDGTKRVLVSDYFL